MEFEVGLGCTCVLKPIDAAASVGTEISPSSMQKCLSTKCLVSAPKFVSPSQVARHR